MLSRPPTDYYHHKINLIPVDEVTKKTIYNDNWLEQKAINHLSRCVQDATGLLFISFIFSRFHDSRSSFEDYLNEYAAERKKRTGYESLVQTTRAAARNFKPSQGRQLIIQALEKAIPTSILQLESRS